MLSSKGSSSACILDGISTFLHIASRRNIVQPYVCEAACVPRSRLGAVPRLVSAPCAISDKARYVNFPGLDCAGVAALGARKPAYLLPEPALGVRCPGSAPVCRRCLHTVSTRLGVGRGQQVTGHGLGRKAFPWFPDFVPSRRRERSSLSSFYTYCIA